MPEIQCLSIFLAILTLSGLTNSNPSQTKNVGTGVGIFGSILICIRSVLI